jgi:hypothetical protein
MAKWTTTPQEYAHVRSIIVDGPIYGNVEVTMNDGRKLRGFLTGSSSGNNVKENLDAGRGPIIDSIWGEIRIEPTGGNTLTLDAMEIFHVQQISS